jgi:hypothetical protein
MPNLHFGCLVEGTIRLRSTEEHRWRTEDVMKREIFFFPLPQLKDLLREV